MIAEVYSFLSCYNEDKLNVNVVFPTPFLNSDLIISKREIEIEGDVIMSTRNRRYFPINAFFPAARKGQNFLYHIERFSRFRPHIQSNDVFLLVTHRLHSTRSFMTKLYGCSACRSVLADLFPSDVIAGSTWCSYSKLSASSLSWGACTFHSVGGCRWR